MFQALVDTGADDIVFPEIVAARTGIDLSAALPSSSRGAGANQPTPVLFAPVILLLDDGKEKFRWRAVVGFAPLRSKYGLFGIAGGLEYFRMTLDIADRELLLEAKPSLPVTQDAVP
ncbi:MAG: retroviral-like aspartic protease family protein [Gemmataceae bacterium]|nr:retroviral-like aspartic protease family protein [Gemmataceae bacterium]